MKYCRNCGNRLDDLDGYCSSCGAQAEDTQSSPNNTQDKRTTVEDSINNLTESASKNFVCGIASLTLGTFICAIVSLVFAKIAKEKGQDNDKTGAMFCKVGAICSKVCIALSVLSAVVLIVCSIVFWI